MIETYEDLPNATNKEVLDFLKEQLNIVLKKADMNRRIFIACFNTILKEIEERMKGE